MKMTGKKKLDLPGLEHRERKCEQCGQSIVLTGDGCFVSHNMPDGWTGTPVEDEIYIPARCPGSGQYPARRSMNCR